MNPLFELGLDFLILLGEACVFFALCWLIAKKIDNWSIVDVAWSYGFALVGLQMLAIHFWVFPLGGQGVMMAGATVWWSLRLGAHLAGRVLGHLDQEDGRYLKMRAASRQSRVVNPMNGRIAMAKLTVTAAETASGVAPWRSSATSGSRTRRRSQSETRPIQATLRVKNTLPRSVSSPDCFRQSRA